MEGNCGGLSGVQVPPHTCTNSPEHKRARNNKKNKHHNGGKTWNIDKKRALEHRHLRWNIDTIDQPPRVHRQILRWNSDTTFWNKHRCRCSSAKLSMFPREIVDVPAHKTSMFQCVRLSMFLSNKCGCSSVIVPARYNVDVSE